MTTTALPDDERGARMDKPTAEIGVFGGSGFYELLDSPQEYG